MEAITINGVRACSMRASWLKRQWQGFNRLQVVKDTKEILRDDKERADFIMGAASVVLFMVVGWLMLFIFH